MNNKRPNDLRDQLVDALNLGPEDILSITPIDRPGLANHGFIVLGSSRQFPRVSLNQKLIVMSQQCVVTAIKVTEMHLPDPMRRTLEYEIELCLLS